jgi:hypothetical protein
MFLPDSTRNYISGRNTHHAMALVLEESNKMFGSVGWIYEGIKDYAIISLKVRKGISRMVKFIGD